MSSTLMSSPNSGNTNVSRSQFKPILFSTPMVEAIIAGKKTQTRRMIKEAKGWDINWKVMPIKEEHLDGIQRYEIRCGTQYHLPWFKAKCGIGDILWVRETWRIIGWDFEDGEMLVEYKDGKRENVHYPCPNDDSDWMLNKVDEMESAGLIKPKSDDEEMFEFTDKPVPWKPSIFMPKEACRIWLEVTDVRAERLHDITGDDVLSEGVDNGKSNKAMGVRWENMQRMQFQDLWNKINKNWNDNPYVWVITFKLVECPQGFC